MDKPSRPHKTKECTPPATKDEAKEWLHDVAAYLAKIPNASNRFVFASKAINSYLDSEAKSLDHAFGLISPAGRKKRKSKHFDLAREVFAKKYFDGMSWKEICDEYQVADERELRRKVKNCRDDIFSYYSDRIWDMMKEDF